MKAVIESLLEIAGMLNQLEEKQAEYYHGLIEQSIDSIRQLPDNVVTYISDNEKLIITLSKKLAENKTMTNIAKDTMSENTSEYVLELEKRVAELHAAIGDWESKFSSMEMMRNKLTHEVNELENTNAKLRSLILQNDEFIFGLEKKVTELYRDSIKFDKLKLKNNIVCRRYNAQTQELIASKCETARLKDRLKEKDESIAALVKDANNMACELNAIEESNASPEDLMERLVIACNKRDGE